MKTKTRIRFIEMTSHISAKRLSISVYSDGTVVKQESVYWNGGMIGRDNAPRSFASVEEANQFVDKFVGGRRRSGWSKDTDSDHVITVDAATGKFIRTGA